MTFYEFFWQLLFSLWCTSVEGYKEKKKIVFCMSAHNCLENRNSAYTTLVSFHANDHLHQLELTFLKLGCSCLDLPPKIKLLCQNKKANPAEMHTMSPAWAFVHMSLNVFVCKCACVLYSLTCQSPLPLSPSAEAPQAGPRSLLSSPSPQMWISVYIFNVHASVWQRKRHKYSCF